MNFRPELAAKVMAGEKTETRRVVSTNPRSLWWTRRCGLRPGRDYAVCPGRTKPAIGRVYVTSVVKEPLYLLDDRAARHEGFSDQEAFRVYWRDMHGSWIPEQRVWVVRFTLAAPA